MNAIPWYRSTVLISAIVSIVSQILVILGKQDLIAPEVLTGYVEAIFQVIALVAAAWTVIARSRSKVQPVTMTATAAAAQNKQSGRARPAMLVALGLAAIVGLGAISACTGTRAAYKAAESLDEYAYVVTEHYAGMVKAAADIRQRPGTAQSTINALRTADNAVAPLVLGDPRATPPRPSLQQLAENYRAVKDARTEAELQAAVDAAIIRLADLVRAVKSAGGN